MKTRLAGSAAETAAEGALRSSERLGLRPSYLCFVNGHEVQALGAALAGGAIPQDFKTKLGNLAAGALNEAVLERRCRTLIELAIAAQDGSFKQITQSECDHLLRVLAYVRKDDDAIPDYRSAGYVDDQEEVRAAMAQLLPLLEEFKAWRLQTQVPNLWRKSAPAN